MKLKKSWEEELEIPLKITLDTWVCTELNMTRSWVGLAFTFHIKRCLDYLLAIFLSHLPPFMWKVLSQCCLLGAICLTEHTCHQNLPFQMFPLHFEKVNPIIYPLTRFCYLPSMASKALLVECNLFTSYSIALEKLYPSTHGRWLLSPTPKVLYWLSQCTTECRG